MVKQGEPYRWFGLFEPISLPNTREYLGLIWHMSLAYVMFFLPNKSPR